MGDCQRVQPDLVKHVELGSVPWTPLWIQEDWLIEHRWVGYSVRKQTKTGSGKLYITHEDKIDKIKNKFDKHKTWQDSSMFLLLHCDLGFFFYQHCTSIFILMTAAGWIVSWHWITVYIRIVWPQNRVSSHMLWHDNRRHQTNQVDLILWVRGRCKYEKNCSERLWQVLRMSQQRRQEQEINWERDERTQSKPHYQPLVKLRHLNYAALGHTGDLKCICPLIDLATTWPRHSLHVLRQRFMGVCSAFWKHRIRHTYN